MLAAVVVLLNGCAVGDEPRLFPQARYAHAQLYLPEHINDYVSGVKLTPHWQADGNLVYEVSTPEGVKTFRIDPVSGEKQAFTQFLPTSEAERQTYNVSPNGRWAVRLEGPNLVKIDLQTRQETKLTKDGAEYYAYGHPPDADLQSLTRRRRGEEATSPVGWWSPDGDTFLSYRVDERKLKELPYVVSILEGAPSRLPFSHVQKTAFPGDESVPLAELMAFNLNVGRRTDLKTPPPMIAYSDTPFGGIAWSADGSYIYTIHESRDFKTQSVYESDILSGRARQVVTQRARLPIRNPITESGSDKTLFRMLNGGKEIILYSEEDDWAHYYLYDAQSGRLKNRITKGEWVVHDIKAIDEETGTLFFTAGGREEGRDPYYSHLYSIGLDGSNITLLTPENAHHTIAFAPDGEHFVDTYSTVSTPQTSILKGRDGAVVADLGQADISKLQSLGWRPPERFKVKAADGVTDIYGVLFFPYDLDEHGSYPIIDAQYSGPQGVWAPYIFLRDKQAALGLAQLGFVVMLVDGRGTPKRSQSFQDVSFGEGFGSPEIVADHIAAIRQLAERHKFIDSNRAGIYGHSWGGYRAARAMFQFPGFFKSAVAASGSHDNFIYVFEHDRWFGSPDEYPDSYLKQSNMPLSGALEGDLLLIHGEADDNVHPANTLQLADALIKAGKKFDMFIYPNRGHDITQDPYYVSLIWDYFIETLLDMQPPKEVVDASINGE